MEFHQSPAFQSTLFTTAGVFNIFKHVRVCRNEHWRWSPRDFLLRGLAFLAVTFEDAALDLKYEKLIKLKLLHVRYHLLHFNQLNTSHLASI